MCWPWIVRNGKLFPKSAFTINMRNRTITCPAGERQRFELGVAVEFRISAQACHTCSLRAKGTNAGPNRGQEVAIAASEALQAHTVVAMEVERVSSDFARTGSTSDAPARSATSRSSPAASMPPRPPRCLRHQEPPDNASTSRGVLLTFLVGTSRSFATTAASSSTNSLGAFSRCCSPTTRASRGPRGAPLA